MKCHVCGAPAVLWIAAAGGWLCERHGFEADTKTGP